MTNDENKEGTPGQEQGEGLLERRAFLNGSWKVLGAALVIEAGWTSYDLLNPKQATGFGGVVDAGPVEDFLQEGDVKYFLDGRFYVTQHEGGLRALYQKCPHLGCRVPFCESSQRFECPCHGSVYNLVGEYIQGPTPRGMDRFPIEIREDGHVYVDTSSIVEGPARGILTGPTEAAGPSCVAETGAAAPPAAQSQGGA
jgi:cytochrome b6-f complex iron-sulfur subunit